MSLTLRVAEFIVGTPPSGAPEQVRRLGTACRALRTGADARGGPPGTGPAPSLYSE